nr:hypothetical protein [Candidatus Microthrix sp.]
MGGGDGGFEISRRHRFTEALRNLPDNIAVHVLPTGDPKSFNDVSQYRRGNSESIERRIDRSYEASVDYLNAFES